MAKSNNLLIAIGASAGGFEEILKIVEGLPRRIQAVIMIATHRKPDETNLLASILDRCSSVDVVSPVDNEYLDCATIYVGAPSESVKVEGYRFDIEVNRTQQSRLKRIDDLFISVASSAGENAVGVLLSGMLSDGVEGMKAISAAGGRCIIQDPEDASYDSMPRQALDQVKPDFVGTAEQIVNRLIRIAEDRVCLSHEES